MSGDEDWQFELLGMPDGSVQVCHHRVVDDRKWGCGVGKFVGVFDDALEWVRAHECPR